MTRRARGDWVSWRVPAGLVPLLAECIYLHECLIVMDSGDLPGDPGARRVAALEAMLASVAEDARYEYTQRLQIAFTHDDPDKTDERAGKWAALCRDGFRSVLSGHSHINYPGRIVVHHIWPIGQHDEGRPDAIHGPHNLATVTEDEHLEIHADWRKWVDVLREKIAK